MRDWLRRSASVVVAGLMTSGAAASSFDDESDLGKLRTQLLRAEQAEEREAALRAIALTPADEKGVPSRDAAKLLARGLMDEAMSVRVEAVRLLGMAAHREVALLALIDVLESTRTEMGRLSNAAARGQANKDDERIVALIDENVRFARGVIEALGHLPDDRSVKTLSNFSEKIPTGLRGRFAETLARSLVRLGTRSAWQEVIRMLPSLEARAGRGVPLPLAKAGKKAKTSPLQKVHDVLVGAADVAELDRAPEFGDTPAAQWRKWYERHQRRFPARLGRIDPAIPDDG